MQLPVDMLLCFPCLIRHAIYYHWLIDPTLQWRHIDHDDVSNRQPHGCLLNHLFRRRSKKISKLRVTGLCVGNSPGPVNSPHKGPVTRKMFPFDDVIMLRSRCQWLCKRNCRVYFCKTMGIFVCLYSWFSFRWISIGQMMFCRGMCGKPLLNFIQLTDVYNTCWNKAFSIYT